VVGRGGVLDLDGFEPGVLARRLVEVAVDAELRKMALGERLALIHQDGRRILHPDADSGFDGVIVAADGLSALLFGDR
jgi:hypothetical protein